MLQNDPFHFCRIANPLDLIVTSFGSKKRRIGAIPLHPTYFRKGWGSLRDATVRHPVGDLRYCPTIWSLSSWVVPQELFQIYVVTELDFVPAGLHNLIDCGMDVRVWKSPSLGFYTPLSRD